MGLSQIGESYSYIYNAQTGKLRTKDGTQDDFVDYFNGDLKGEDSETLNGIDRARKAGFDRLINIFGHANPNLFTGSETGEYEITAKQVDAMTAEYSVDGRKAMAAYTGETYTSSEIRQFLTNSPPFKTRTSKGYDFVDNSINMAVGDRFNLGNGSCLVVGDNRVYVDGKASDAANRLMWALNTLIHFADQQMVSSWIDKESTPMLLELLRELGVDTDREFIINGTKCEVRDGRIREAGYTHFAPSSVYNAMVKRYEDWLYMPLSEGKR